MNLSPFNDGVAVAASQSREPIVRPALPNRNVNASTIEDAYVSFIFYCNPALPSDLNTESLREAFRTPPKSGGKTFDTFTIYELVQKLYQKEIKNWSELSITLGVEPPDLAKDESTQKKWMNSMHVKSFFEYLMNIPNDYWTRIPNDPNPIGRAFRDGIAVADDMALRALLPHFRPKRGHKRPDEDESVPSSPARRSRLSSSSAVDHRPQGLPEPWSAHSDDTRSSAATDPSTRTQDPSAWGHNKSLQTPVAQWPHYAVTPFEGNTASHRRRAKNVPLAWITASQDAGFRPRGWPPSNRTPVDGPSQYSPQTWTLIQGPCESFQVQQPPPWPYSTQHRGDHDQGLQTTSGHRLSNQAFSKGQQDQQISCEGPRPARPSISLQVPERWGGSVRLATPLTPSASFKAPAPAPAPAPALRQNQDQVCDTPNARIEQFYGDDSKYQDGWRGFAKEATDASEQNTEPDSHCKEIGLKADGELEDYYFEKMEDRTNIDVLVAYFTRSMSEADWRDQNGSPTQPANLEESTAMVHAMLQTMYKTANSPQTFLINLAALAGSTTLLRKRPKCTRLGEHNGQFTYKYEWQYQFGRVKGGFTFEQVVPATMWTKTKSKPPAAPEGLADGKESREEESFSKEYWQRKYEELTVHMMKRDKDLADLKEKITHALGRDFL